MGPEDLAARAKKNRTVWHLTDRGDPATGRGKRFRREIVKLVPLKPVSPPPAPKPLESSWRTAPGDRGNYTADVDLADLEVDEKISEEIARDRRAKKES